MTWDRPKAGRTARGYGTEHMKERARRVAEHDPWDPCSCCGKPLGPDTSKWHLPHNAARTGYLPGLWCASCNIRDGARRGARIAAARKKAARSLGTFRRPQR